MKNMVGPRDCLSPSTSGGGRELLQLSVCIWLIAFVLDTASAEDWKRHTIDRGFDGADGVRLADFNGDQRLDIVTGWEESGLVRLYLQPTTLEALKEPWPAVTIAKSKSPEDAVPCDVDGDGRVDVVSCHEGRERKLLVHWNETSSSSSIELLRSENWRTSSFKKLAGQAWMYATPVKLAEGRLGIVAGSKGKNATITLLVQPDDRRRALDGWEVVKLRNAGWIMSLEVTDVNLDGLDDIMFSDRKGERRAVAWLEQPSSLKGDWTEHSIDSGNYEYMFLSGQEPAGFLMATRNGVVLQSRRETNQQQWLTKGIQIPVQNGKSVAALASGQIVITSNTIGAKPPSAGIWIWSNGAWSVIDSTVDVKFDRIELLDIDQDGDQDILCCEERQDLGVFWYENPGV